MKQARLALAPKQLGNEMLETATRKIGPGWIFDEAHQVMVKEREKLGARIDLARKAEEVKDRRLGPVRCPRTQRRGTNLREIIAGLKHKPLGYVAFPKVPQFDKEIIPRRIHENAVLKRIIRAEPNDDTRSALLAFFRKKHEKEKAKWSRRRERFERTRGQVEESDDL